MDIREFRGPTRWLSNYHEQSILWRGVQFPTNEHAYQADKCADPRIREIFATLQKPRYAQLLGQVIQCRPDWEQDKLRVMLDINRLKFANEPLREMLLATGDGQLVEGNTWHDNFWGTCLCDKCGNRGQNNLGKILMQIRLELASAIEKHAPGS
jgi:ribA/ribD-fused uncharacterized protein